MRASIRQAAERANVSRMTVSRVLQGRKGQVNEDTYLRVLAAMNEMNYVPVRPAMQNRHVETNATGHVPYYLNPSGNPIDSLTVEGLCTKAGVHGYDLYIMLRAEAEWMANREDLRFLDRRCDGFIFISPGVGEWQAGLDSLIQHEIPSVVCYRRDVPAGVAWVDPDNEANIRLALEHLTSCGHSCITYFTSPRPSLEGKERLANLSGVRPNYDDAQRQKYFTQIMCELGHADDSITLTRYRPPNNEVTAYNVYMGTKKDGPFTRMATVTERTATHSKLPADTKYFYTVSATNANGESAQSRPVEGFTIKPIIATPLPVKIVRNMCVSLGAMVVSTPAPAEGKLSNLVDGSDATSATLTGACEVKSNSTPRLRLPPRII